MLLLELAISELLNPPMPRLPELFRFSVKMGSNWHHQKTSPVHLTGYFWIEPRFKADGISNSKLAKRPCRLNSEAPGL